MLEYGLRARASGGGGGRERERGWLGLRNGDGTKPLEGAKGSKDPCWPPKSPPKGIGF